MFVEFGLLAALVSTQVCGSESMISIPQPEILINLPVNARSFVQEQGQELEYWHGERWNAFALPTIRFGIHYFEAGTRSVRLRTVQKQKASARVLIRCNFVESAEQRWHLAAQALAEKTEVSFATNADVALANKLSASAPDAHTQAYGRHLYAVTLMRANRWLEAESHVAAASLLWNALGETALESSALLAAASFSDRRSAFELSSRYTAQAISTATSAKQPYVVLRAKDFACRAIHRANRTTEYLSCVAELIREHRRIGEITEEIALTVDLMLVMREYGLRVNASPVLARLIDLPTVPDSFVVRGRAYLAAGHLATDIGDLTGALACFQRAFADFSNTLKDAQRWQVNTLIQVANLEANLGLIEQALSRLNQALIMVNPKEAPARIAAVLSAYGNVLAQNHEDAQAKTWFQQAQKIQTQLAMTLDANTSRLLYLQAGLGRYPAQTLLNELTKSGPVPANYRIRRSILAVRLQAALDNKTRARQLLSTIDRSELSALDAHLLALADAELFGKPILLSQHLSKLSQTADQSPTASLAYLTLRSGEKVRRAWIDSLTASTEPAAVFKTALLATPARFMTSVISPQKQVEIVAKQAAGEQGFLAQLTGLQEKPPERFKAARVPTLAQFQAGLPEGAQALLLLPGDKQSAALWLSRSGRKLVILPARAAIMAASLQLNQALASPQSAPKAAEAAAAALSSLLFSGAPVGEAPKQLWILADELSAAIPFSALPWPGSSVPLVQSTEISLMTGVRVDLASQAPQTVLSRPTFFAPAYAAAGKAALQSLEFVGLERARIERESAKTWAAIIGLNATRAAFQNLIQTPGAWLHVAAHGKADPGVLGNAGLWLANSEGPDADFLSWLELGNIRNQAELMVLNACQSATGAQPSRQANVSFALAMSTSGANHVVAALWPVSDVASSTWIPAFYRQLGQSGNAEQSASAVRQAQLSLYHSPHYRHPFYWASLVHFRRVVF